MTKIMGSLPNLHELSKGKLDNPVFNPAPIGGLRPAKLPAQPPPLAHTHRRARSGGHHHNVLCDNEAMLEHMATYSPVSYRSTRTSGLSWRRKDSVNSSAQIGEVSSVRRLIATVRATPSGERPPKKMIIRHCVALFIGHAVNSAAILPLFPLQAGLGAFNSIMGPMLLAVLYIIAAITSCLSPFIVQILGANIATCVSHLMTIIFVGAHFYPKWYVLTPIYAIFGVFTSTNFLARISHVDIIASNLSLVCFVDIEDSEESKRKYLLRKLSRFMKLAEDIGLAIGCLIAAIVIKITDHTSSNIWKEETGEYCGSEYCLSQRPVLDNNTMFVTTVPFETSIMLVSVWLGLSILSFGISCAFLDSRIKNLQLVNGKSGCKDKLSSMKEGFCNLKLQLAAPLTFFIGLEQGFILADFTQAYIECALGGAGSVVLSFLSMALLQALAGITLSMLLRQIKRYLVAVIGIAFHACLILVLLSWKPAGDDPGLFHVISAAWGVCNSIWESLICTLILGLYPTSWQGPLSASLLWRWLGLSLALGLHGLFCTKIRVFGLAFVLVVSFIPYLWLEVVLVKREKIVGRL